VEKSSWFRALLTVPGRAWRKALGELAVIAGISMIPLFAKLIVRMYHGYEGDKLPLGDALTSILKEGELLFLAMGLVAAVIWMSAQDYSKARFDERIWFFVGCLLVSLAAVFFIGVNPDFKTLPAPLVRDLSYVSFITACVMYLLMTVFTKFEAIDYRKSLDKSEDDLLNRLNEIKQ
jgi:hypothetical protein